MASSFADLTEEGEEEEEEEEESETSEKLPKPTKPLFGKVRQAILLLEWLVKRDYRSSNIL